MHRELNIPGEGAAALQEIHGALSHEAESRVPHQPPCAQKPTLRKPLEPGGGRAGALCQVGRSSSATGRNEQKTSGCDPHIAVSVPERIH